MNIPRSKLDRIKQQHSNIDDCNRAFWELYLEEHPFPSWQRVAYALYKMDHLEELEVVQKKYLKGIAHKHRHVPSHYSASPSNFQEGWFEFVDSREEGEFVAINIICCEVCLGYYHEVSVYT